jgi:hypothetical protein
MKLRTALFGELSLEEAKDLPQDRLLLELERNSKTASFLAILSEHPVQLIIYFVSAINCIVTASLLLRCSRKTSRSKRL